MGLQLKLWLNLALATALLLAPTGAGARHQQVSSTAADAGWVVETIDSANDVGRYSSLALDPANDFPRISYYDATAGNLKYAAWDGMVWQIDTVDSAGDVGQYSSLALDPVSGAPRIAYHDATNGNMKYAAWNGTAWQITVVEDLGIAGSAGMDCSLAIEPTHGHPRISYRVYYPGTGSFVRYASWNGTAWQFTSNFGDGSNTGYYTSLALDPSSALPRISFQNRSWYDGDLMFASSDGAVWQTQTAVLTGNVGAFSSLALDPDTGQPRIAHYYANTNTIEYATWDGANWSNSTLPFDSQGYCSLALDSTAGVFRGYPRIAHRSRTTTGGKLMYAAWDGSAWQSQTVYDQSPIAHASLRLDRVMGEPRIAYYDQVAGDLKLATRRVPPSPTCEPGYVEVLNFGPDDLYAPSDPSVTYAFTVTTNQAPVGELRVWQGEGHFWDADCNAGPDNDDHRRPCDQGQSGEIVEFYLNGNTNAHRIGQFTDHNPDDDRNFYYEWPLSNVGMGRNTLYLTNEEGNASVFYRGTLCVESGPPLAVSLSSFETVAQPNDILLRWETASEVDNTGFNVYRATGPDGERTLLTFVPSQAPGSSQGFAYEWLDSDVTAGETYHYWLEAIDTSGATALHGPVSATFQAPSAVTVDGVQAAASPPGIAGWWVFAGVLALLAGTAMLVKRR